MQKIFDVLVQVLSVLGSFAESNKWQCALGFLICFAYSVVSNPQGAINQFMIHVVDVVFLVLPSTPQNYKLANILADFGASNTVIGWGVLWQVIQLPLGLLGSLLVVKLIKFIKP